MMATGVSLLAGLLESILQGNRELLLELNVSHVISSFKRDNPAIAGLDITPDLHVKHQNLPESQAIQSGIASLIFTVREFLEVFLGTSEADSRVGNSVQGFVKGHDPMELAQLRETFPDLFSMGAASPEAGLNDLDDVGKVCSIFAHVMRRACKEPGIKGDAERYVKECAFITTVSGDLEMMNFKEGMTMDQALGMFSEAVEKLAIPPNLVREALQAYGGIPQELGISARLFSGALSDTEKFGCAPIDWLLRDGLGRGCALLLEGPAGVEKEVLAAMYLREGLRGKGCAIIVGSLCSAQCIKRGLESAGLDLAKIEAEGRLIFVDWHSRFVERVTSIDVSGNVLKVSNDLTNLAVGVDMALKMAKKHPQARLVMDMASPTILTEGFDRVHEFLNSVRAKMKSHSCSGIVLLNPGMHTDDQTSMVEEIFDGTMMIERHERHGRFGSNFRIANLSGTAYSPARLGISISQRGMEVSADGDGPREEERFDHEGEKSIMGLLGIESLSPDGLPMGRSYLVWMPSSMMPADFVKPVVMEAQKDGLALLLALSSLKTEEIGEWMSEKGLSRKGLIDRGLLQIVDWYGQRSAKVLGMELDEGIIRTSRDLTHLGVGIDAALSKIGEQFSSMAVMETMSQAIRLFDLKSVYSFAQFINAKLAARGFTVFILMERDAHDPMVNAAMEELFDGIIDIRPSGGSLELAVLSIRGGHFQSEYRPLTKLRDRLTLDVSRRIPDSEIAESIAGHGISSKLKDMEKMLEETLREKQELERRLAEFGKKEGEYQLRHGEMSATLREVEARLAQAQKPDAESPPAGEHHKAEVARLLKVMDDMLEKLPQDVIDNFAQSEDFKLYEKILALYLEEN